MVRTPAILTERDGCYGETHEKHRQAMVKVRYSRVAAADQRFPLRDQRPVLDLVRVIQCRLLARLGLPGHLRATSGLPSTADILDEVRQDRL